MVALTYKLAEDDLKQFQLGTPSVVACCVSRCWQVGPTNERVLDDIQSWEFGLDKIIEARVSVVY